MTDGDPERIGTARKMSYNWFSHFVMGTGQEHERTNVDAGALPEATVPREILYPSKYLTIFTGATDYNLPVAAKRCAGHVIGPASLGI